MSDGDSIDYLHASVRGCCDIPMPATNTSTTSTVSNYSQFERDV